MITIYEIKMVPKAGYEIGFDYVFIDIELSTVY